MSFFTASEETAAQNIIDCLLNPRLGDLQRISVEGELGTPDRPRNIITYTQFPMIVDRSIRPQFEHNALDVRLVEDTDYTLDLTTSQITLLSGGKFSTSTPPGTLPIGDEILGFYNFKYFTDDELKAYLSLGLAELNARKPTTSFPLDAAPLEWNAPLAMHALIEAFYQILSDTTLWRSNVVFNDPAVLRAQIQEQRQAMEQRLDYLMKVVQRRGWAAPKLIFSQKIATQQRVTPVNFRDFTIQI